MKKVSYKFIFDFAGRCIARAKAADDVTKNMQIFKTVFEVKIGIDNFHLIWKNKLNRAWQEHIFMLGQTAIYGQKGESGNIRWLSGAIEQLGRFPKVSDKFYFEYLSGNSIHRFLKVFIWDDKLVSLNTAIYHNDEISIPVRRCQILSDCSLKLEK